MQIVKHVVDLAGDCTPKAWKDQGDWLIRPEDQIKGVMNTGTLEIMNLVKQIVLHLSPNQQDGKVIEGNKLRAEMKTDKVPVLNACVLNYLLLCPELVPKEWKTVGAIFFWGTVYCSPHGNLCVRFLYWDGGAWDWSYNVLGEDWNDQSPSAILASVPQP